MIRGIIRLGALVGAVCGLLCVAALLIGEIAPRYPLLAFISDRDGTRDVYIFDPPRNRVVSLRAPLTVANNVGIAASDDGRLAFEVFEGAMKQIYIWNRGTLIPILQGRSNFDPLVWSAHDASSCASCLAFVSNHEGNLEVYVWDGTQVINISQYEGDDDSPSWSPDGRLAYVSNRESGQEIFVWGHGVLSPLLALNFYEHQLEPAWSPDGRLAFTAIIGGNSQILVWSGDDITLVSEGLVGVSFPSWSIDGKLAFLSVNNGSSRIHIWNDNTPHEVAPDFPSNSNPLWDRSGGLWFAGTHGIIWNSYRWDGHDSRILPFEVSNADEISFNGNVAAFVLGDNGQDAICLWDGAALRVVIDHPADYAAPVWIP